ncbi:MAG: hypothetical protein ACUVWN_12080 [bacterium]
MSDSLEILNPNRGASSTPPTFTKPSEIFPLGPKSSKAPGGGINPVHVRALIDGIKLLRSIEGVTDEDIIDFIMQAISLKGLQLSYEDIKRLVEAVPAEETPPAEENIPQQVPPQT